MARTVKKVTFAKNNYGLLWLEVNTQTWQIVDACGVGRNFVGRACRLADRGMKLEYRNGDRYTRIEAAIEKMG